MYLSTLKLHGFKSFADPTELQFDPGVTAIVGPNGCGKSNIVDAIRWVIGEQRPTALRSEKMENVIFNGTARRRALGMAEVELTIQNNRGVLPTEYTEITIGRRLFRSGESEYLMNGTQCRLKDITELFMDTGMGADAYSVIELKMIDEILSDNAQDRRQLFEEAAGITKYKQRRRQALRKLENTHADLTRIRDLIDEIGKSLKRLKWQAEKAATYEEYEKHLHALELELAQVEFTRLREKRRSLREKREMLSEQLDEHEEQERNLEEHLSRLREKLTTREEKLSERRQALQAHRDTVRDLEADLRLQTERLETARRDRERLEREAQEAADRKTALAEKAQHLEAQWQEAHPSREKAEAALEAATSARDEAQATLEKRREGLQALRRKARTADEHQAEQQRTLDRHLNQLELLEQEQQRAIDRLDALDDEATRLKERLQQAADRLDAARSADEEARVALQEAEREQEQRQAALEEARDVLRQHERQRDAAAAEVDLLEGLVSSYEEFSDAVRFLAGASDWTSADDLRTVADVLACDEADRVALDAALGDLASCIVVATEDELQQALRLLRDEVQGQATFIVLSRLPEPPAALEVPDGAQPLRRTVRVTDPSYQPLAELLLHGCYLTASLEEAQALAASAPPPARFFTRSGEWVDARGFIHGGSQREHASAVAGRLGRREQLDAAREELARLERALEAQQAEVAEREAALAQLSTGEQKQAVEAAAQVLRQAEQQHDQLRYEQQSLTRRRKEQTNRLEELDHELEQARAAIEKLKEATAAAEEEQSDLREALDEAETAFQQAEAAHRKAQEEYSQAKVEAVEARNRAENLRRERERVKTQQEELATRAHARKQQQEQLRQTTDAAKAKRQTLEERLDTVRAGRSEKEAKVKDAEEALAEIKSSIAGTERRLRQLRQQREEQMRKENQLAVRLAEVNTRLQDLVESIEDDFGCTLEELPEVPDDFDESSARDEVRSLRGKLRRLGEVNPLALEEYEEKKERFDFLEAQRADLEQAEDTLLETIEEINSTAAERFNETFEAIQENFSDLFERLFGEGARAHLELEDSDDPLESSVEIFAQPRGKKPSILAQLSSGEKALTSIALLFAIYLVKPSPFCVLDEVDAPLDDTNVQRFMHLLRDFVSDTQFILVTHNKHTMARADRMYGITMQEQGVSKLVGVEFSEALELAES